MTASGGEASPCFVSSFSEALNSWGSWPPGPRENSQPRQSHPEAAIAHDPGNTFSLPTQWAPRLLISLDVVKPRPQGNDMLKPPTIKGKIPGWRRRW